MANLTGIPRHEARPHPYAADEPVIPAPLLSDPPRRGRAIGERNGRAKLSASAVREARAVVGRGGSVRGASRALGVHNTTLLAAVRGRTWKHVA